MLKNQIPNAGQGLPGFRSIQESLKRSSPPQQRQPRWSTQFMPQSSHNIFNKEREGNVKAGKEEDKDSGTTLTRPYSYEELGKRLGELRSAGAVKDGKEWFSLEELQGRIAKLVELEKQENRLGGQYADIRKSIFTSIVNQAKPAQPFPIQTILGLGAQLTPDYTRLPPQAELVERVRLAFAFPSLFFSCSLKDSIACLGHRM